MRRAALVAGIVWLVCAPAAGQTLADDRPGPYVIDVRGATVSLPGDSVFFPLVPFSTAVPSRGFGIDAGAHVYLLQLGPARIGLGLTLLRARGSVSATVETEPDVAALFTAVGPQISANWGSRAGWSYLSAGVGRARITTRASAFVDEDNEDEVVAARRVESDALSSVNFGGGARWFAKTHIAFSFDVRFHLLGAASGEVPTPGSTRLAASVGLSFR